MPRFETKPCAAHGCSERIKRRLLMCSRHWRMIPHEVQDRVINALDAWQRGGSVRDYVHAVAEAQLAVALKDGQGPEVIEALTADVRRYQEVAKVKRNFIWIVLALIYVGIIYARFTLPEWTNNVNCAAEKAAKQ